MDLLPVSREADPAPSAVVVVITAVPVPTLLIWKIYPSRPFSKRHGYNRRGWKKWQG